MDSREIVKPIKIDLFSEEGQRYLRDVVSMVDVRNYTRLDTAIASSESSEKDGTEIAGSTVFRHGCTICNFQCNTVPEQREHFQSEWHLFNLRRRLKSKSTMNEEMFEDVLKGSKDVQKSESSTSDTSSDENEANGQSSAAKQDLTSAFSTRGGAVFFLTKSNQVVSCYRGLLTSLRSYQIESQMLLSSLQDLRKGSNIWIVLILSGGHFAAAVFDNSNLNKTEAVVHKTVHRYTVRAKQGGAQSQSDAQKGKAKSAGANLRRFNEEALEKDIHNILTSWNEYVRRASAILLRCAIYKRQIFFAGDEPLFSKADHRIRNIPFVTHRPTYEETKRVRSEMATLDVYESYDSFVQMYRNETTAKPMDLEEEMKRMTKLRLEKKSRSSPKPKTKRQESPAREEGEIVEQPKKLPKKADVQKQEFSLAQDVRHRLYTVCKRGDAVAMRHIIEEFPDDQPSIREYLNSPFNDKDASTFLHLASASGHLELVRFLLDIGCDPRVKNGNDRVPFQVANAKPTRNVFSQFRDDHPMRWDWNQAQIPELVRLDPEIEASKKAKLAEKKKAALKAKAEKQKEKKEADAKARAEEEEQRRYLQLSDREKRALAAEKRWQTQVQVVEEGSKEDGMAKVVLSRCFRCGIDITGKVPFEYSENRFCSVKCVKEHRTANS